MEAPASVGLFTIEGTQHGPYPGAVTGDVCAFDAIALHPDTADQLLQDLNQDDSIFTGSWKGTTLRLCWTTPWNETATTLILPDTHGRYRIGGLWPWADWDGWDGNFPHTDKQAFALGVVEFRFSRPSVLPGHLQPAYSKGRETAHQLTLNTPHPGLDPL
ncbi:hypothetical protein ACQEVG_36660 [Streptomyces sp. CA-135486]|uniref:hypothetical protein n=1 Tax=Streptomyces sp. CA-135486 TaxID=3240049 RepID=UPI003D8B1139